MIQPTIAMAGSLDAVHFLRKCIAAPPSWQLHVPQMLGKSLNSPPFWQLHVPQMIGKSLNSTLRPSSLQLVGIQSGRERVHTHSLRLGART